MADMYRIVDFDHRCRQLLSVAETTEDFREAFKQLCAEFDNVVSSLHQRMLKMKPKLR